MIYLDQAATTYPKPAAVYTAMDRLAREGIGNPGRSGHRLARASERILADARFRLCRLIGGADPSRIVFTLNGTDAINIAVKGLLEPGDHVVTGLLEHNSVRRPIARMSQESIEVTTIPFDERGYYDPEDLRRSIRPNTRLVALSHASNVLGTVQPIEAMGEICRSRDVLFLVDAAQTAGCWPIDVEAMSIDLLAAPGHKALFGPTGTGFLYVGPRANIRSWREGGTGGDSTSPMQPEGLPEGLEAGTANVVGIAGLLEGVRFIEGRGVDAIARHEEEWINHFLAGLASLPGVRVLSNGFACRRVALATFSVDGFASQEVASILDSSFDIAIRAGLHCAPAVHQAKETFPDGAIRASASVQNSISDAEGLLRALADILGQSR